MRNLRSAEFILALAVSRERAQAIAGDLVETAGPWFWLSVLTTALAFATRGITCRLFRVVLRGFLWQFVYQLITGIPLIALVAILMQFVPRDLLEKFFYPASALTLLYTQYRVGRFVLTGNAVGRELSAWLMLATPTTLMNSGYIVWQYGITLTTIASMVICFVSWEAPMLTGIIVGRTRAQAPRP